MKGKTGISLQFGSRKKSRYLFNGSGTRGVMPGSYFAGEMGQYLLEKDYFLLPEVRLEHFFT